MSLKAFEVAEDTSVEFLCLDCGHIITLYAQRPELTSGKGFFSNLNLADVVAAAKAHDCDEEAS